MEKGEISRNGCTRPRTDDSAGRPGLPLAACQKPLRRLCLFSEALGQAGDLQEVCDQALDGLHDLLEADCAALFLPDAKGSMRCAAASGLSPACIRAVEACEPPLPPGTRPPPLWTVTDVERAAQDLTAAPGAITRAALGEGIRAMAVVPLLHGGLPRGLVVAGYDHARVFDEGYTDLARSMAAHLASAIVCRQGEEKLLLFREALRRREEFLSIAAHEIRGPLGSLLLSLTVMRMTARQAGSKGLSLEWMASKLDFSERQGRRLQELLDKLLDISLIDAGMLRLRPEEVDLALLAREVAAQVEGDLHQAGSQLCLRASQPVLGMWDRVRLGQVLTNLLSNAIKYGDGQPVMVEVEGGRQARLRVIDRGIGIGPEDRQRIFEIFRRAVRHGPGSGMGLGLYIVRGIVEAMGGTIQVCSEVGAGSTFVVDLPYLPPAEPPRPPARPGAEAVAG